jgi:hypothetical protein
VTKSKVLKRTKLNIASAMATNKAATNPAFKPKKLSIKTKMNKGAIPKKRANELDISLA